MAGMPRTRFERNFQALENFEKKREILSKLRRLCKILSNRVSHESSRFCIAASRPGDSNLEWLSRLCASALPPTIKYDPPLTLLLSQADAALSELSGLGRYLPNPDLLIAPYVKREAVASSRIEGTQADLSDLLLDEIEPKRTPPGSDVKEVRNCVAALNRGIRLLDTLPLASRLVRRSAQSADARRGQPGRHSRRVSAQPELDWSARLHVGECHLRAAAPRFGDARLLEALGAIRKSTQPNAGVDSMALIHEHFEAIHPFIDGNGRVGRLLIPLFLIERERLSKPLLYLSSYIEQTRNDYYRLLQQIRTHGEWDGWLRYFLTAVRDTSQSAIAQSQSLLKLREHFRGKLDKKHMALTLLDELFINPYATVTRAAKRSASPRRPRRRPSTYWSGSGSSRSRRAANGDAYGWPGQFFRSLKNRAQSERQEVTDGQAPQYEQPFVAATAPEVVAMAQGSPGRQWSFAAMYPAQKMEWIYANSRALDGAMSIVFPG